MTTTSTSLGARLTARQMLNKVPEITLWFWIIKVLCTTVGETASDYLATNVGLGLTNTTFITGSLLIATLVFQFRARRYLPVVYWFGIVLISVVGTQITDNLTDNAGVSLITTTIIFSVALVAVFAAWYAVEKTLSIHTIFTTRREAFYWLAVLFTFALGTAAGDLVAERLALGFWKSALMFAGAIAAVTVAHYRLRLDAVAAFWIAYVLSRPLGASIGDYLSQPRVDGGLTLGTTLTSLLFLGAIVAVVAYLTASRADVTETRQLASSDAPRILVVTVDGTSASPQLLTAVRERAARGEVLFHLLILNAAHAEVTTAERRAHHEQGQRVLAASLPAFERATGLVPEGSVSVRHDPMDAIEEAVRGGRFDEVILSTRPHHLSERLHLDLPDRVAHLGLPLTVITQEVETTTRRSASSAEGAAIGETG